MKFESIFVMKTVLYLFLSLFAFVLHAQSTDQLVVTTGTTVVSGGKTYAYILWEPGEISATLGRRFAIYSKDGPLASTSPFSRLGIQTLQSNPETIHALLRLGAKIDFNAAAANLRIGGIYHDTVVGAAGGNAPDETLNAAGKLSYLIGAATEDPQLLNQLLFLGRAHPGVMQALGHAIAIPIPTVGVRTFEVREIDLSDNDIRVIGRVELNPAAPFVAPVPGPPVQVRFPRVQTKYEESPKNNLSARFRWGLSNTLRRAMPETFGFDLFRVREDCAVALGWNTTPPTTAEMIGAVLGTAPPTGSEPGDIARINELPILVDTPLSVAQAANPSDLENYYFHDDNWLSKGGVPFKDGDTFYYFVAARDITGRPGTISPGVRVVMCDRLPPLPPKIYSVENVFTDSPTPAELAAQAGDQRLRVRIRQLDESLPAEAAGRYFIYRWNNPREALTASGGPEVQRVGIVDHVPGATFVDFTDTGAGAPAMPANEGVTYWYTVRAEDLTRCTPKNLSAHSSPKFGVLRDRSGPPAPTGQVTVCNYLPSVSYLEQYQEMRTDWGIAPDDDGFGIRITRNSPKIVSAEVKIEQELVQGQRNRLETRTVLFGTADVKNLLFRQNTQNFFIVSVRVRTAVGKLSPWLTQNFGPDPTPTSISVARFLASVTEDCQTTGSDPDEMAVHEPVRPDGTLVGVNGTINLTPDAREWRVYRRVGHDGPQTLIAKDEGPNLPTPAPWTDDSVPAAPGTIICYYLQIFDQNGNPSPRVLVKCITIAGRTMPVPMLSEASLQSGPNGEAMAKLTWFCDPVGAERFELLAAAEAAVDPELVGSQISARLGEVGTTLPIELDGKAWDAAIYQTPRVATTGFGPGPSFTVTVRISVGQRLAFAIRAVGDGVFDDRQTGGLSNVISANWAAPGTPSSSVIPWPARPLPNLQTGSIPVADFQPGSGPYFATELPSYYDAAGGIIMGGYDMQAETISYGASNSVELWFVDPNVDPMAGLFRYHPQGRTDGESEPLTAFVVYRYQVPNAEFADAVPNLVQVSPLIDRMAWKVENYYGTTFNKLRDPFFRFPPLVSANVPVAIAGESGGDAIPVSSVLDGSSVRPRYLKDTKNLILWTDPMPYIRGASYRYLIACFDPVTREISRVIPTNPVHPAAP